MTSDKTTPPTVSIISPCLNEVEYIDTFLNNLIAFDYPKDLLEVVIADGTSTDGTREKIEKFIATHADDFKSLCMLNNPGGNKARALNSSIENTTGEIVMRLDIHARYSPNYISALVGLLGEDYYSNVGAVRRNISGEDSFFARIASHVLSSKTGLGNAPHYTIKQGVARSDVVHLFCVKRTLFKTLGKFDERLIRGQDRDFNMRIKQAGLIAGVTANAHSEYFIRTNFKKLCIWLFECGATPIRVQKITGRKNVTLRNLMPMLLVLISAGAAALSLHLYGYFMLFYLFIGAAALKHEKRDEMGVASILVSPILMYVFHILYGLGSIWALAGAFNVRK